MHLFRHTERCHLKRIVCEGHESIEHIRLIPHIIQHLEGDIELNKSSAAFCSRGCVVADHVAGDVPPGDGGVAPSQNQGSGAEDLHLHEAGRGGTVRVGGDEELIRSLSFSDSGLSRDLHSIQSEGQEVIKYY